jgi:hypothetical protein
MMFGGEKVKLLRIITAFLLCSAIATAGTYKIDGAAVKIASRSSSGSYAVTGAAQVPQAVTCKTANYSITANLLKAPSSLFNHFCSYLPGDINGHDAANGIDIVYLVQYLKGGPAPPASCNCPLVGDRFFAAGDVNGDCSVNGLDVIHYVNFLKGGPGLLSCPNCRPLSPSSPSVANQPAPVGQPHLVPIVKPKSAVKSAD